jgi:hypothetical protein
VGVRVDKSWSYNEPFGVYFVDARSHVVTDRDNSLTLNGYVSVS